MNYYENIVIFDASLNEETLETAEKRVVDTIEKADGKILKFEKWGIRKLAYEINKHEKGFYVFIVFTSSPAAIKALESLYKVFDPVFKYMIIKLEKKEIQALQETLQAQKTKDETSENITHTETETEGES